MPVEYKIEVSFKDNDIIGIKRLASGSQPEEPGEILNSGDINKFKKSPYGLRVVDSVSYTQQVEPISELIVTLTTNCYTVIGGFKVKVPCS